MEIKGLWLTAAIHHIYGCNTHWMYEYSFTLSLQNIYIFKKIVSSFREKQVNFEKREIPLTLAKNIGISIVILELSVYWLSTILCISIEKSY